MKDQPASIYSKFCVVNGHKIHYLHAGFGPQLLLLHTFLTNAATFRPIIDYLSQHYEVFAPDMPGFGFSDEITSEQITWHVNAKVIAEWILHLDLKDFILAGVSMGGTNAAYLARLVDSRVKGYVLVEPFYGVTTFKFNREVVNYLKLLTSTFLFMPPWFGNFLWQKRWFLSILDRIGPFKDPKEKSRSVKQKMNILGCAKFRTFWRTLELILNTDLSKEIEFSQKQSLFVMSEKDESLDCEKTFLGFKKLFPRLKKIPIEMTQHYPVEPITKRYIDMHYPSLLKRIIEQFKE